MYVIIIIKGVQLTDREWFKNMKPFEISANRNHNDLAAL
jgi:hypothetical protein